MRKVAFLWLGLAGLLALACCRSAGEGTSAVGVAPAETASPAPPLPQTLPPTVVSSPPLPAETAPGPTASSRASVPDGRGNADVQFVRAVEAADGSWTFHVTVEHLDTGWEDYADGWDVVTPDGMVLKPDPDSPFTRLLLHPHETEQPFTRSQGGILLPEGVTHVRVRAHDLVDGYGGREVVVDLGVASGPDFAVERAP